MSRDPFLRLALLVLVAIFIVGIVIVERTLGLMPAVIVICWAPVVAFLLTFERRPAVPERERHKPTVRFGGPPADEDL